LTGAVFFAGSFRARPFRAETFFAERFFAATFLADEAFFVGFVTFFRDFLGDGLFGADFTGVRAFDFFFFLEPAMVAISDRDSLANSDRRHNCNDRRVDVARALPRPRPTASPPPNSDVSVI